MKDIFGSALVQALSGIRRKFIGGYRSRHWRTHKVATSFPGARHEGEQRRRIAQQIRALMKADGTWADYLASGKTYSDLRAADLEQLRIIRAMCEA